MENLNWIAIFVAGLVPMAVGALWYGPLLGKQWMASTGKSEEFYANNGNMGMIMGISVLLSILLAFTIKMFIATTHADHYAHLSDEIVGSHHTFGHGMLHGAVYTAFWVIPFLVINGMFERRGPKNYWLHIAYWIITCAIMGGILDAWN